MEAKDDIIKQKNRRITSNTLVLFARMLVITVVNLYTVRWILSGLGVEDFGIFNAVAGVVTASSCLSMVLAISTQRFYAYAIGQGREDRLREIFSASLNIVVVLALLILIAFELFGPWFIDAKLTIPAPRLAAAHTMFHFSLAAFLCTLLQIPFIGAVFAHENMGIYALVSMADCLVKLLIAVLVSHASGDRLVFYAMALAVEAFLVFLVYALTASRKYAACHYQRVHGLAAHKELLSFSGWTFYSALAGVGTTQGCVILVNAFFGPVVNAAFSISNQVYNALNTLSNSIVLAFRPAMTKAYSGGDTDYLSRLFGLGNKALFYLLVLFAIPFIFETDTILTLWLGQITGEMVVFARLYVVYTICLALHNPVTTIIQATGQIRNYTLAVESLMILNIPLCWVLFRMGLPPYWVFITMITLCILAHAMRLFFLKRIFRAFSLSEYLNAILLRGGSVVVLGTLIAFGLHEVLSADIVRLLLVFVLSPLATLALIYAIGMNNHERSLVLQFVKNTKGGKKLWH